MACRYTMKPPCCLWVFICSAIIGMDEMSQPNSSSSTKGPLDRYSTQQCQTRPPPFSGSIPSPPSISRVASRPPKILLRASSLSSRRHVQKCLRHQHPQYVLPILPTPPRNLPPPGSRADPLHSLSWLWWESAIYSYSNSSHPSGADTSTRHFLRRTRGGSRDSPSCSASPSWRLSLASSLLKH